MASQTGRAVLMITLTLVPLTSGCASPPASEAEGAAEAPPSESALQQARLRIDEAIGEARASGISQCAFMPVGVRPCGGPRRYVAYSLSQTDSVELADLVAVYDRLDRERNERLGLVSTCEVIARPRLDWVDGRCVTVRR